MIWTAYEIGLNIFQGFLFSWFVTKMLVKKQDEYFSSVCCAILTALALSSYLFFEMPEVDTWTFIFIILYAVLFFKGTLILRLFWSSIPIVVSMAMAGMCFQVFAIIFSSDMDSLMLPGIPRIVFTMITNLLFWVVLFLIAKLYPEKKESAKPSYLLLIINIFCVFLIDLFFETRNAYQLPLNWLLMGCTISLIIGITTVITHRVLIRYTIQEQQLQFQKQQIKEQHLQMELLQETYKTILQMRHDIKAYANDIEEMVRKGDLPDHSEFLRKLENQVTPAYSTGNLALDSVLPVKVQKIKSLGIEFRGANLHYTGGMNINDFALCSLVSNMLDNAIEALTVRENRKGHRYISLEFIYNPAGLIILCENPLLGVKPKMQQSYFFTQKSEAYHGLGISIMERITKDAGGQLDIVISGDLFRVIALIPLKGEFESEKETIRESDQCFN